MMFSGVADRTAVAVEPLPPGAIRDHGGKGTTGGFLGVPEQPAARDPHTQCLEKPGVTLQDVA
jgi:hypothetical protein